MDYCLRYSKRLTWLIVVCFVSSLSGSSIVLAEDLASAPPEVYVDEGVCPGECCQYGRWRARKSMVVRREPKNDAARVATIPHGKWFRARTGKVIVRPTQFIARHASKSCDEPETTRVYRKRDTIWVYTELGEGFHRVWFEGKMYEEKLPPCGPGETQLHGPGKGRGICCWGEFSLDDNTRTTNQQWWVQVQYGTNTGWVRIVGTAPVEADGCS